MPAKRRISAFLITAVLISAAFAMAVAATAQRQSTDCRFAGTWVAQNGDTMVLGGIANAELGGSYQFSTGPNAPITMKIDGRYRLEGSVFHFRGKDQYGAQRDVSMPMTLDNPSAPSLLGLGFDNKVAGRGVQTFQLRQQDPGC
jgi:hypothetical protein